MTAQTPKNLAEIFSAFAKIEIEKYDKDCSFGGPFFFGSSQRAQTILDLFH
jgi:hypothetical protein